MTVATVPEVSRKHELQALLVRSQKAMHDMAPPGFDVQRAARVALAEATRTPQLLECTPASIVRAVAFACQLGLEVGSALGQFYLVPFWNKKIGAKECTPIVGYKGLVELALQSGHVEAIDAGAVYEGDEFHHEWGTASFLQHRRPPLGAERGKQTGVYAYAVMAGGRVVFEVMDLAEVEKVRTRSRAKDSGPWQTDYEAMSIKTVLRRLINRKLAKSVKVQKSLVADQLAEEGGALEFEPEYEAGLPQLEDRGPADPVAEAVGVEPGTAPAQQQAPAPAPPAPAPAPKPAPRPAAKPAAGDPPPPTRKYAAPCDPPAEGQIPVNARMGQGKYAEQTYEQVAVEDPAYLAKYYANRSNSADVRVQAAARYALEWVGHAEMLKPLEDPAPEPPADEPPAAAEQQPPQQHQTDEWWKDPKRYAFYEQTIGDLAFEGAPKGLDLEPQELEGHAFKALGEPERLAGATGWPFWQRLSYDDLQVVYQHLLEQVEAQQQPKRTGMPGPA